jgi:phage portal protein BeeE
MAFNWPWRRGGAVARVEQKAVPPGGHGGLVALHGQGEPRWTRRDYAALAREGYMRNPVVHRAVRMVAEAAACVPWLAYDGTDELETHPLLDLLERPNQRQAGSVFLEALYGTLLLAGNAYVELIEAGEGADEPARELHLLRPDRVTVVTESTGWPVALDYREGSARRRLPLGRGGGAAQFCLFHPLDDHYGFRAAGGGVDRAGHPQRGGALEQGAARQFGTALWCAGLCAKGGRQFERGAI